ncbi:MAG: 50S ribosomal protein L32e [Candidatus Parvarchaeota archaeon]|nr:50S ribosomal protein L32e [Candidatus Haiyanarchaeum thermophilum]MCW1303781.1 50S ribosomal protein L32e [Candidatus Haiyanarchaeum thermophilum]MCW1309005.1 50S ribosomal protein L32e [Candidatus Haiyanarchaeum thermophilum]
MERLLRVRRKLRRKKPKFLRRESHRRKRLEEVWRRPRGSGSRQRLRKCYVSPMPEVGYRKPKAVRGLHPCGLVERVVENPNVLTDLDPKKHILKISSRVGKKKKMEIVKRALELGFKIANVKPELLKEVKTGEEAKPPEEDSS